MTDDWMDRIVLARKFRVNAFVAIEKFEDFLSYFPERPLKDHKDTDIAIELFKWGSKDRLGGDLEHARRHGRGVEDIIDDLLTLKQQAEAQQDTAKTIVAAVKGQRDENA